jgi:hypothetical protein
MMMPSRSTAVAAGCLFFGVLLGVAGAQVVSTLPTRYLNSGLFTVAPGEGARVSVAVDDYRTGPPAQVTLQLRDQEGAVVTAKTLSIQAGQSAVLETRQPGVYRAHAQVVDRTESSSDRRTAIGSVEVGNLDLAAEIRSICMSIPGGLGRIRD